MSTGRKTMGARFLLFSPDFKYVSDFRNIGNASNLNVTSHAFKNTYRKFSANLRAMFRTDVKAIMSLFFAWNDV
jgi:hypothetical protein